METQIDTVKVETLVGNLPTRFTNKVDVLLRELIQDETGTQVLATDHISLKPRGDFTPHQLSRLLRDEHVPESHYLGQKLAFDINHSLATDDSLREPVFVYANVNIIRDAALVFPPDEPKGAPWEVIQRLADEQRVESLGGENETQCSICIEDFSKTRGYITRCLAASTCFIKIVSSSGSVGETRVPCAGVFRTSWIKKQRLKEEIVLGFRV